MLVLRLIRKMCTLRILYRAIMAMTKPLEALLPNPALSIAGPGRTGLSKNPLAVVDTALSGAGHKALRDLEKP
jgi:hypothetical protein